MPVSLLPYSFFFSSVVPELELLLGVLLAPELGVELVAPLVEPEEAPLLGAVLGDVDELEPELGELGVVALPEAEPPTEPGARLVASLEDDPDEDVEPDGEDGVVAPRELSSGPRSQP